MFLVGSEVGKSKYDVSKYVRFITVNAVIQIHYEPPSGSSVIIPLFLFLVSLFEKLLRQMR